MKNLISKVLIGLSLLSLSACDKYEEDTLYNKDSAEINDIIAWASTKCIAESKFFTAMTTYADFSAAPYAVGDIYKIKQDNVDTTVYAKITAINAADMVVEFNSVDNTSLNKIVTFTEAQYAILQTTLQSAACTSTYSDIFSFGGLSSTTSSTMTWDDKNTIITIDGDDDDDDPDRYRYQTDSLAINLNYPIFLYYYNGTKTQKKITTLGEEESTSTSKIVLTDATSSDECNTGHASYDSACAFPGTGGTCTLTIDTGALTTAPTHESSFLTGCDLLESNP